LSELAKKKKRKPKNPHPIETASRSSSILLLYPGGAALHLWPALSARYPPASRVLTLVQASCSISLHQHPGAVGKRVLPSWPSRPVVQLLGAAPLTSRGGGPHIQGRQSQKFKGQRRQSSSGAAALEGTNRSITVETEGTDATG